MSREDDDMYARELECQAFEERLWRGTGWVAPEEDMVDWANSRGENAYQRLQEGLEMMEYDD